jgi:hypothetical protein
LNHFFLKKNRKEKKRKEKKRKNTPQYNCRKSHRKIIQSMWDGKGYHNVHAHTTGTGETAAQQRCVLSIESSM